MSSIQMEVLWVLSKYPDGLKVSDFTGAYYKQYGRNLVLYQHGYKNLKALLNDMKDKVDIEVSDGKDVIKLKSERHSRDQALPDNHFEKPECSVPAFPLPSILSHNSTEGSEKDHSSGPRDRSYKDVLKQGIPSQSKPSGERDSTDLKRLKESLRDLMKKNPEGMSLTQVRRSCGLLHDPVLLEGFASTKQLLASLNDVVRLQGYGVQTQVLPAIES